MSDELVKNLRNMAEYNDRREFGADYKDDIHWKAADRIEELERHLTNEQEAADEASRQYHVETEGHDKYIEELEHYTRTDSAFQELEQDFFNIMKERDSLIREVAKWKARALGQADEEWLEFLRSKSVQTPTESSGVQRSE